MTAISPAHSTPTSPAAMLHASNLLTYASLVTGLGAIVAALWFESRAIAGAGIALSVVLDTFDGRFARRFVRTAAERAFGVQLDSLADAINSGVVPIVVAMSLLRPTSIVDGALWMAAAFVYLLGVVTRLGYYNLTHDDGEFFTGLPAPVAALLVATLMLWPLAMVSATILFALCGVAMVGPIRIPRPRGFGLFSFVLWPVVVGISHMVQR